MSEVLVAPAVFGVAALPAGLLLGGLALTAVVVRRLSNNMESRSRKAYEDAVKRLPQFSADVLRPPSLVEHDVRLHMKAVHSQLEQLRLPAADQMRVSALLSLASGPYVVENPSMLEQPLASLLSATTLAETNKARRALMEKVKASHQQAFSRGLTHACTNAIQKVGFATVETSAGPLGEMRVIGTDTSGRSLVAEIRRGKNGDPTLAAEVVGVRDGSCHKILDDFEKAMAEQGVRYTPPQRRPTGGVCQLEAARDFIRKRLDRASRSEPNAVPEINGGVRRAQRLNQRKVRQTL